MQQPTSTTAATVAAPGSCAATSTAPRAITAIVAATRPRCGGRLRTLTQMPPATLATHSATVKMKPIAGGRP